MVIWVKEAVERLEDLERNMERRTQFRAQEETCRRTVLEQGLDLCNGQEVEGKTDRRPNLEADEELSQRDVLQRKADDRKYVIARVRNRMQRKGSDRSQIAKEFGIDQSCQIDSTKKRKPTIEGPRIVNDHPHTLILPYNTGVIQLQARFRGAGTRRRIDQRWEKEDAGKMAFKTFPNSFDFVLLQLLKYYSDDSPHG